MWDSIEKPKQSTERAPSEGTTSKHEKSEKWLTQMQEDAKPKKEKKVKISAFGSTEAQSSDERMRSSSLGPTLKTKNGSITIWLTDMIENDPYGGQRHGGMLGLTGSFKFWWPKESDASESDKKKKKK